MLVNTTGNSAIMPLTVGPTQPRQRHDGRDQRRDQRRAQRDVVPAARDQRHLDVPEALEQRDADRKRDDIRRQGRRRATRYQTFATASRVQSRPRRAADQLTSAL